MTGRGGGGGAGLYQLYNIHQYLVIPGNAVRVGHCLEVLRIVVSISSATSTAWVLGTFEASQLQFQLRHLVHLPLDHYKAGKTG